jgi:hypothetical protein
MSPQKSTRHQNVGFPDKRRKTAKMTEFDMVMNMGLQEEELTMKRVPVRRAFMEQDIGEELDKASEMAAALDEVRINMKQFQLANQAVTDVEGLDSDPKELDSDMEGLDSDFMRDGTILQKLYDLISTGVQVLQPDTKILEDSTGKAGPVQLPQLLPPGSSDSSSSGTDGDALREQLGRLTKENEALQDKKDKLQDDNNQLQDDIEKLQENNDKLNTSRENYRTKYRVVRDLQDTAIKVKNTVIEFGADLAVEYNEKLEDLQARKLQVDSKTKTALDEQRITFDEELQAALDDQRSELQKASERALAKQKIRLEIDFEECLVAENTTAVAAAEDRLRRKLDATKKASLKELELRLCSELGISHRDSLEDLETKLNMGKEYALRAMASKHEAELLQNKLSSEGMVKQLQSQLKSHREGVSVAHETALEQLRYTLQREIQNKDTRLQETQRQRNSFQKALHALTDKFDHHKATLVSTRDRAMELISDVQRLTSKLSDTNGLLSEATGRNQELGEEKAILRQRVAGLEEEGQQAQSKIERLTITSDNQSSSLETFKGEMITLRKEYNSALAKLETSERTGTAQIEQMITLRKVYDSALAKLEASEGEGRAQREQMVTLRKEYGSALARLEALERNGRAQREQMVALRKEYGNAIAKSEALERNGRDQTEQLEVKDREIQTLMEDLGGEKSASERSKAAHEALELDLDSAKEASDRFGTQLQQAQEDLRLCKEAKEGVSDELVRLQGEAQSLNTSQETLQTKFDILSTQRHKAHLQADWYRIVSQGRCERAFFEALSHFTKSSPDRGTSFMYFRGEEVFPACVCLLTGRQEAIFILQAPGEEFLVLQRKVDGCVVDMVDWECWLHLKAGVFGDAIGVRLVIDKSWISWMGHAFIHRDTTVD